MVTFWGRVLEANLSLKFGLCTLYQIHQKILAWVRPSPLSGNARILEVPIPVTYPLFTGRLVGWRKDEGNAGQDTWGLWTILDEFSKNFQTASEPPQALDSENNLVLFFWKILREGCTKRNS